MKNINVVAAIIIKNNQIFATQRGYGEFKDWWEFPGGKINLGETPVIALAREIKEELDLEINIKEHFITVEYDYPNFHLNLQCFLCTIKAGSPKLLEHENSAWLNKDQLDSVQWLPADITIIEKLKVFLATHTVK